MNEHPNWCVCFSCQTDRWFAGVPAEQLPTNIPTAPGPPSFGVPSVYPLTGSTALAVELAAVKADLADVQGTCDRLADLLKRTAIALKGQEPDDVMWDWSDLPARTAALQAEVGRWKDAIIDACVVDWIFTTEHESNPRKAVNDLLCWQQRVALDPAVSWQAAQLVQRAEAAERDVALLRALLADQSESR